MNISHSILFFIRVHGEKQQNLYVEINREVKASGIYIQGCIEVMENDFRFQ